MSIRLRFTLFYTIILAITLGLFSVALHRIQEQETLNSLRKDISLSSNKMMEAVRKNGSRPLSSGFGKPHDTPPISFEKFSNEQAFKEYPEGEIVRILDGDGQLVASPFGRENDALPLSPEGLKALRSNQDWWEMDVVSGEEMMIYSQPVVENNETIYIIQTAQTMTERDRNLHSMAMTMIVVGLLTILIAFGMGWVLSGITLRPIKRITQTAKEIGENHDFSRRVAYKGPQDEVGQLANTFNGMLERIQEAFEKVDHSLKMQKFFVADVSHELRTPLTTLRGNLDLVKRKPPAPPEEQADILEDMVYESDRLIRLVNDLLLVAHADAGRNLAKEPLDVSPVIGETCRQAKCLDSQRNILLELETNLSIVGDRDAVKQILLIGLDNALKHSTGDILIHARHTGSLVEISLQDQGKGIPTEKLEHIFDRFYRSEENSTLKGFGLGLSIAKSLVERQGGSIRMESELGKGSRLILTFPSATNLRQF